MAATLISVSLGFAAQIAIYDSLLRRKEHREVERAVAAKSTPYEFCTNRNNIV